MTGESDATIPGEPLIDHAPTPAPQGVEPRGESRGWGGRRRGAGRPKADAPPAPDRANLSAKPRTPKRTAGRPSTHATRAARTTALYEQLASFLTLGSVFDSRLFAIGQAIETNAVALGESWATWADTSPRVAAMLDRTSFGGAGIGVLIAHVPIVKAIMSAPDPDAGPGIADILASFAAGDLSDLMGDPEPGAEHARPMPGV